MAHSIITIIPVYNHPDTMDDMLRGVLASGQDCIVVDDGSDADCARVLCELAARHAPRVELLRLAVNEGKGGAMMAGMRRAQQRGFTHAVQIDADGQHATADIPVFAAASRKHPDALICGAPIYDESVPKVRLYGRYATHVWVWINTLSLDITDSMCGFRVYPLAATMRVVDGASIGKRMEFDAEIVVRLHWQGVPFVTQYTRVTYPQDGLSHFRVLRDNVLISKMHARLFAGMLLRSPVLLARKILGRRNGVAA
ncbi:glycosyltransferase family 2 protein [Diaphorobacter aerolatus]|uniref:Glycosyltransferase family 2 protein n=1 Tax=Diaphorobacter aerolatus TaxID=1288495 RepID=A0A7H0GM12_9BURK|nr:glycosyltransferase family 2 protein [Diaphorobacter aerolatus]QNP49328.1 glycosyltransferase family 2 protein [Diaphorobacter aerolatus]